MSTIRFEGCNNMDMKRERTLWLSITVVLAGVLAAVMWAPVARAQSDDRVNNRQYLRDLETAMYILENSYVDEVDPEVLFQGAMEGMFNNLDDPYTVYLDGSSLEQLTDTTEGKYGGVGLYIIKESFNPEEPGNTLPYVKVVAPIENTPGWRAGLNAGDYIYAIEGESAEDYSTREVSEKLRGLPGSTVNVTILRDKSFTYDVELTRQEIEIPTVKSTIINRDIAYLRIIEFTPYTEPRVREKLQEFRDMGLDKMVIDVRNNPGGLLESVVDVANHFFSGGVVVSTRYRQKRQNRTHRAAPGKIVPSDTEIVVLIDKGSASASEILTGALKDRDRATVIGQTSFGKGSIQQLIRLNDAAVKLTTGRYYTPDGVNIDKTGIDPDILVEEPEYTDEQTEAYATLLRERRIRNFVDENPSPSPRAVNRFIKKLQEEGIDPGERLVRLLVKRESERRMNVPPVVDMEFDTVLIRAVDFLENGE